MGTVLEWTLWIVGGLCVGWGLARLFEKYPVLVRKTFPNFWDCVIIAFWVYAATWIPQHASHHITRIAFIVLVGIWYVWSRRREIRKARDAS